MVQCYLFKGFCLQYAVFRVSMWIIENLFPFLENSFDLPFKYDVWDKLNLWVLKSLFQVLISILSFVGNPEHFR